MTKAAAESEETPYCCVACGARVGFGHAYLISFVDGRPSRCSKCTGPWDVEIRPTRATLWVLALCLQSTLLGLILPFTFTGWGWLRGGAVVLVITTAWTAFRLRDAQRP
jgi:DNA-directed RNA polymerase subunit RPC12/RpoP